MTNSSVIGEPLLGNDILNLARIFEVTFEWYGKSYGFQSEAEFNTEISMIMGLGFTTALVDGSLIPMYEEYLQTFLHYRDCKDNPEEIMSLSLAIAQMINGTVYLLRFIDPPQYYEGFIQAVQSAVNHHLITAREKSQDAERLLKILFKIN